METTPARRHAAVKYNTKPPACLSLRANAVHRQDHRSNPPTHRPAGAVCRKQRQRQRP
ncbi:hypothetical protein [Xanthomonas oryzae]|uniref:hypothetical protein n=1 Tax=Xanthomonas oryzae TaxID=347 RepID=UPI000AF215F9|nr:hypothetical protein [Xanthomonas oryzae]